MPKQYLSLGALGGMIVIAVACGRESSEQLDTTHLTEQTHVTPTNPLNSRAPLTGETASTSLRSANPNSSDSSALTCTPTTFSPGDTLTLRMGTPHGHYLWITKSDRTAYLVVYPAQGKLKAAYSLVPSDDFTHIATMRVPAEIQAIPFVYGRDTIREPVFSEPGRYLLEVGDNFATDFGAPAPSCSLTFVRKLPK